MVEAVQRYAAGFSTETRFALLGITIVGLKSALLFFDVGLAARMYAGSCHALRSALIRQLLSGGYVSFARHDQDRLFRLLARSTCSTDEALRALQGPRVGPRMR